MLLSESNQQQQDLDRTLNDLSSLKLGYALLQQDNIEQAKRFQELLWINQKLLWQLEKQHEKLGDIDADLQEKAETLEEIEGRVHPCGGTGWIPIPRFDMRNPDQECPEQLDEISGIPVRACGRTFAGPCDAIVLPFVTEYRMMCGRIKAFQIGDAGAFSAQLPNPSPINPYVHGIVLARLLPDGGGLQHIWTFAVGSTDADPTSSSACPCAGSQATNNQPPDFVEHDYFCESGNKDLTATPGQFYSDTLWDGKNCFGNSECCAFSHPPYFVRDLGVTASGPFGFLMCTPPGTPTSNIALQLVELYIK